MAGDRSVAIVGGGHNALVAATLLARAGARVTVFERADDVGGAAISSRPFAGVDATVSPYAYLVSLFPAELMTALGVTTELRRRRLAWCLPEGEAAVVMDRADDVATAGSFAYAGLSKELPRLRAWEGLVGGFARVVAPTLLEPLRTAGAIRELIGEEAWELLCVRPLGSSLSETFESDLVRGLVLTDGLIGTFSHADDPSLAQNRCFLYHVIGNGSGEWRVPVGGMGALTGALADAARRTGVDIKTGTEIVSIDADGRRAEVETSDGNRYGAAVVLCGAAPGVLGGLLGRGSASVAAPPGAQVKINMVLSRLPSLRADIDPTKAFTGTLHVNEGHGQLDAAWRAACAGALPDPVPCEVYCHSLTDDSVLGPSLRGTGAHTLSLFALQTPAALFAGSEPSSPAGRTTRQEASSACLASFQSVLAEPLEDVLLRDEDGRPCLDVHSPVDLEAELGLPGGNIFHDGLWWPWAEEDADIGRWGVETDIANVFVCGSGARRGGAVSGIGGHNAAMAALGYFEASGC